jgi:hypothetical protein
MKLWKLLTIALAASSLAACSSVSRQSEDEIKFEPPVMEQETEETLEEVIDEQEPEIVEEEKEVAEPKPLPTKTNDGKLILGAKEWVYFPEFDHFVQARVDSKVTTSSLSAVDIIKFERDGKPWVKFKAAHNGKVSKQISLPMERLATLKSTVEMADSSEVKEEKHPVVAVWIQLGELKAKTEFTLVDRSKSGMLVLLGQSFVQDVAVVDGSRTYVQPKSKN